MLLYYKYIVFIQLLKLVFETQQYAVNFTLLPNINVIMLRPLYILSGLQTIGTYSNSDYTSGPINKWV